jgi:hypothetical protein
VTVNGRGKGERRLKGVLIGAVRSLMGPSVEHRFWTCPLPFLTSLYRLALVLKTGVDAVARSALKAWMISRARTLRRRIADHSTSS